MNRDMHERGDAGARADEGGPTGEDIAAEVELLAKALEHLDDERDWVPAYDTTRYVPEYDL